MTSINYYLKSIDKDFRKSYKNENLLVKEFIRRR